MPTEMSSVRHYNYWGKFGWKSFRIKITLKINIENTRELFHRFKGECVFKVMGNLDVQLTKFEKEKHNIESIGLKK